MKKFIFKLILFFLFIVIANISYYYLIKRVDWNFSKASEAASFKDESFDCIVIGNSLAMDGIDTKWLTTNGVTSYNMAIGGANLKANYTQLESYLANNVAPKTVIVGLSSCRGSVLDAESVQPIIETVYGIGDHWNINNIPMLKFKWIAMEIAKQIVSKEHRNAKVELGQLKIDRSVPDITSLAGTVEEQYNVEKYETSNYIDKINNLCVSRNINVFFIEMPGWRNRQNNIPFDVYTMESKTKKEFKVYNLNNAEFCARIIDEKKDWLGKYHLNKYGATKFTKALYEIITSNNLTN